MQDLERSLAHLIPHGFCLSWQPRLMLLHFVSDAVTALAYAAIPVLLVKLVRGRKDLQFSWVFVLFGVFILACGATHVMSLWTLWNPDYLAAGSVKAVTALASVGTALALVPLIPKAIALPGPAQWQAVHEDLRGEIAERHRAEQEVRRLNAELEQRVQERTAQLRDSNQRLERLHAELEQRVRERTRELEQAQAALVDSARQAGMAEIATNVLHNVGNVLNSVTVGVGLLSQRLRQSRAVGVSKAAELMQAQGEAGIARFMQDDPKGRMLPDYLGKLGRSLQDEHGAMVEDLGQLSKSIDHIRDIVATQQTYAGSQQMVAPVQVAELIDDALRMNAGALSRHQVEVAREVAPLPELPLDRHRVLQILVNLISNAKQAMDADAAFGHRLLLRAGLDAQGRLQIAVQDQGDGISAENLTRIFGHGFTTRSDGHGFGLHSCILNAREMGGELQVHSDGPGTGATFTLVLPVNSPAAAPRAPGATEAAA